ncbi:hypothetical protein CMUS01_01001 [Colletotrichum musicola]|uniref:Uncharacterized protein n=1 Tax=Colletotrichum musicola TaxID=2175873 RepID=A0A8H6NXV7_9PEZI|nr:hypothetical protein CMUS01_01001 [Colletotrichum musicola]
MKLAEHCDELKTKPTRDEARPEACRYSAFDRDDLVCSLAILNAKNDRMTHDEGDVVDINKHQFERAGPAIAGSSAQSSALSFGSGCASLYERFVHAAGEVSPSGAGISV